MKYLKIVNCPLNACLIKDGNKVNWTGMGFDASDVSRLLVQGFVECIDGVASGDYITLLPISNEEQFETIKDQIIDNINNNDYENDSADVIEQEAYDETKELIVCVKTNVESGETETTETTEKEEDIEKFKAVYKLVSTVSTELAVAKENLEIEGCTDAYKALTQMQIDSLETKLTTATENRNAALEEYVTKYTDGTDETNKELVEEFTTALVGV